MTQGNTRQTELSFFFLASIGAATLLALVITALATFLFSVFGTALLFSANLWIFLFVFPATLTFSASFIDSRLRLAKMPKVIYSVIVGYGMYSIISLFILLMGGRSEPALWTLLVLALVSIAIFNTTAILARLGMQEDAPSRDMSGTDVLNIRPQNLPIKITSDANEGGNDSKPILSIKNQSGSQEKGGSATLDTHGDGEIIHLGPRS